MAEGIMRNNSGRFSEIQKKTGKQIKMIDGNIIIYTDGSRENLIDKVEKRNDPRKLEK